MTVDLTKCVPGQKLRRRNGEIVEYEKRIDLGPWRHMASGHEYRDNGGWCPKGTKHKYDIIEVLPLEESRPSPTLTCEQVSPYPGNPNRSRAHDDAVCAYMAAGFTAQHAEAIVTAMTALIKETA